MLGKKFVERKLSQIVGRQLFLVLGILIAVFVVAQFIVLATLGTKGAEIANIRSEMDRVRIENEHLRAEIDRARTLAEIEADVYEVFELQPTAVTKVTPAVTTAVGLTP